MIAKLWVKYIVAGDKTFADVPSRLKDQVRALLLADEKTAHFVVE